MNRSRSHQYVLLLLAAVLAAVFAVGYNNPVRLGLDLQGGLEVVLKATPAKGSRITSEQMTQSVDIIRERVDSLGVSEPEIRVQGSDQIAVELAGERDPDRAVNIIGKTAELRFYDFQELLVGSKAYRSPYDILRKHEDRARREITAAQSKLDAAEKALKAAPASRRDAAQKKVEGAAFSESWYLFNGSRGMVSGPSPSVKQLLDTPEYKGVMPEGYVAIPSPPGEVLLRGKTNSLPVALDEAKPKGQWDAKTGIFILMKDDPALTGQHIRSAAAESGQGGWVTSIQFTGKGGDLFGDVTEQIARSGALKGFEQSFAIVLDDEIKSVPTIDYKQYPRGIQGNAAQITGLESREEASDLALVLNSGSLPVRFEVLSTTAVSATLGEQSLRQGLLAGGAGLLVVMVYLIVFYRFLGVIADLALLIYAFIFYGIMVWIPITMTLPGIAGMILTIAVAADANIIIFERVREEYRAGRTVAASIAAGYSKGLRTIIDANAVTLIAAIVLIVVATGSVRGFALLLMVGTLLSMFTAVAATFALLGIIGRLGLFQNPRVIGGSRKARRFNIPWMRYRNVMLGFAATMMVACALLISTQGLNLGIDFKGGTKFEVAFRSDASPEDVRTTLAQVSDRYTNATIQETEQPAGSSEVANAKSQFSIRVEKLPGDNAKERTKAQQDITTALDEEFGLASKPNVQTIGASFGKQLLNGAIVAIILTLILEVIYLTFRFDFKYSIPVLVAIAHDMAIAIGAYALTGREFKSTTVAALLTILGYSLYDTIIVFDRIRENIGVLRKSTFRRIVDVSLNEVLTRSINTSLVVIGPISALYFFGGETLRDFAYALLVGIIAGAYSSLVVASPLLCWMKEREPVWARRQERAETHAGETHEKDASVVATPEPAVEREHESTV
jgi:SecD/SecF fusion protein